MMNDSAATFSIRLADGRISAEAQGDFDEHRMADHCDTIAAHLDYMHKSGTARLLIDLRSANVQPRAVIALLRPFAEALDREGDRVALLSPTSLLKVQLRRILPETRFGIFVSPGAADHFLDRDEEHAMAMAG
ncbi:hypothetical protein [Stakelama pacifica]|uniref:STAS domain-containing protein n=1 Tax=Stakelama pacifica TaxID=517720 RepID=A0A4R6FF98_9SPHN|nr:hypothetical protein [Stakelama pacifica]TDN79966.1 hypothetical protein EV664_111124 [Stakelama pacifica]GGO98351.1 hypothetical protein GCM10011329_29320 [Stakelama pacifica]